MRRTVVARLAPFLGAAAAAGLTAVAGASAAHSVGYAAGLEDGESGGKSRARSEAAEKFDALQLAHAALAEKVAADAVAAATLRVELQAARRLLQAAERDAAAARVGAERHVAALAASRAESLAAAEAAARRLRESETTRETALADQAKDFRAEADRKLDEVDAMWRQFHRQYRQKRNAIDVFIVVCIVTALCVAWRPYFFFDAASRRAQPLRNVEGTLAESRVVVQPTTELGDVTPLFCGLFDEATEMLSQ